MAAPARCSPAHRCALTCLFTYTSPFSRWTRGFKQAIARRRRAVDSRRRTLLASPSDDAHLPIAAGFDNVDVRTRRRSWAANDPDDDGRDPVLSAWKAAKLEAGHLRCMVAVELHHARSVELLRVHDDFHGAVVGVWFDACPDDEVRRCK